MKKARNLPMKTETISVSLPTWVIQMLEHRKERTGINVSAQVVMGVRLLMAIERDTIENWNEVYRELFEES